jgi:hypothetical protein
VGERHQVFPAIEGHLANARLPSRSSRHAECCRVRETYPRPRGFLRLPATVTRSPQERNPIGSANRDPTTSVRWYFEQTAGHANEIALNYRNDLLTLRKATATTAHHLSVVKSLAKYARMTGMIKWPSKSQSHGSSAPATPAARQSKPYRPCSMCRGAAGANGPRDVALLRLA